MYEFSFSLPVTNLSERFIVKNRKMIIHFSEGLVHPAQSSLKALVSFNSHNLELTLRSPIDGKAKTSFFKLSNFIMTASFQPPYTREEKKPSWMLWDSNTSSQRSIHYTIVARVESRGYSSMH